MYSRKSGLILGFHGCDQSLVDDIISGKKTLKQSNNDYDWLGHGTYFWDHSPSRANDFAEYLRKNPGKSKKPIKKPAVLGAIISLGHCLDLLDYQNLQLIKESYDILKGTYQKSDFSLPKNKRAGADKDLLLRHLDCAVIETLHKTIQDTKGTPFDSVRGVFSEGKELYPNAGFKEKDHIQICIRNPNCIKGFFLPRELDKSYQVV